MKKMDFLYEDGLLISKNVPIDVLNQSVEIWVDCENEQQELSIKQKRVLENFFNINKAEFKKIEMQMSQYYSQLLDKKDLVGYSNLTKLEYESIIIPKQENTKEQYLFLLAETTWKIKDSDYFMELEIMIKNNRFDFLQEYTGLWTRLEWNQCYNR